MRLPLAAVVVVPCACVTLIGVPSPLAAPAVAVEHDTYRAERVRGGDVLELTIAATFTNRTSDTIVLHPCHGRRPAVALEKWVDGEWRSAVGQACPDVLDPSAPRLAPGGSRTDTLVLSASFRLNNFPGFELDTVPGLYRVVYWKAHNGWQPDGRLGGLLPKELRVSNAFHVIE